MLRILVIILSHGRNAYDRMLNSLEGLIRSTTLWLLIINLTEINLFLNIFTIDNHANLIEYDVLINH